MHPELRPFIDQCGQKIDEPFWVSIIRSPALADELRWAVDVPSDDEHRRTRLDQRLAQRAEVARSIDQHCGALGPLDTPTVPIWTQNHRDHSCYADRIPSAHE